MQFLYQLEQKDLHGFRIVGISFIKFKTLIIFGDNEKGIITLLDEMQQRFEGLIKHVKTEDYLTCTNVASGTTCRLAKTLGIGTWYWKSVQRTVMEQRYHLLDHLPLHIR